MPTTETGRKGTEILTTEISALISTMKTTAMTALGKGKNEKDDSWLRYTAVVGIAAAVLIICIVIAIVRSRFKSIRKAKAQYERAQMRAKEEIEKQKRASLSSLPTITSSSSPFFIHDTIVEVNPSVNEVAVVKPEAPAPIVAKRSSYVQPIPSFLQALHQPAAGSIRREVTPPPRLSPIFQISEERLHEEQSPPKTHTDSLHPHQEPRESDCPPAVLPREPILPQRRRRYYSHSSNLHPNTKISVTHGTQKTYELSPIFHVPEDRLQGIREPPRRHRISSYPCEGSKGSKDLDCPPELPPRGPIFSSRRDSKPKEQPDSTTEGQSQSCGFITDEAETTEADMNSDNA